MLVLFMNNRVLFLPNLHLPKQRQPFRSPQQILADRLNQLKQKSFTQLGECFEKYIPSHYFDSTKSGAHSRNRVYNKANTFWAFFSQVLDADGGCKEVVLKFQAFLAKSSGKRLCASTSGYCQARKKMDEILLNNVFKHLSSQLSGAASNSRLQSRRVIVVDGSGLSMPDTEVNQKVWPQQKSQKAGCGFPQASICACFNLENGALLSYELGNKKSHELPLLRKQHSTFKAGDIFLGDKGFCSYFDQSKFKDMKVDSVITLARRKPVSAASAVKVNGENDLIIEWVRPKHTKKTSYSKDEWSTLPERLQLRQIKVTVSHAGFRVETFYIVTTLLDAELYPANEIADLYFERWDVELFFRDIKTTMGMDILRCKSPDMVKKEILMHLIAYNCIQSLISEATAHSENSVRRISFKGSLQAVRQWSVYLYEDKMTGKNRHQFILLLFDSVTAYVVTPRPGRSEPRAVKRRPKPYQLLTTTRDKMVVWKPSKKRTKIA